MTKLDELIEQARRLPPMTPEQREEQRRSFAHGNTAIDNPRVTREMIDRIAERADEVLADKPTEGAAMTNEQKISHLCDEMSDPDCTGWTCPDCGRSEFKGAVNAVTGERVTFRLECDECGFDAAPFAAKLT